MITAEQNAAAERAGRATAERTKGVDWEELRASSYHVIDRATADTTPVMMGSKDLGFIASEPSGLRVLHTACIAFFDVDLNADSDRCKVLQHLYRFVGQNPEHGFRVYRTAAGLRYLCTTSFFDPAGDEAQSIMKRLCVDTKYAVMCLASQHFAARLNPKSKRCKDRGDYAVTAYQFTVGNPAVLPECLHILKLHDEHTGAFSDLPLA